MEKPSHNGMRTGVAMALLFAIITVPFVIASFLIIQHRLDLLAGYKTMQGDLRLFESGLVAFSPLDDMRDLAPVMIHTQHPEIVSRFGLSEARADSRLQAFLERVRERDIPGLNDQAGLLSETWSGLTVKTGIPLEDVAGPYDNVNRIAQRLANALSSVLIASDMSVGEGLEPNEVLSLTLGSFRQAQNDIGLIRALALYVSQRGGYLGDNDARRLENAWQRLQQQLSIIDSEIKALSARTGAIELQQQWRLVKNELQRFLLWSEQELILAPRIQVSWEQAYDRSRNAMQSLEGLSESLVELSVQLVDHTRQEKLRGTIFLMLAVLLLYALVLGLALLVYRSNSRAISARAESLAKGQFLARMSHEIRTPLNGVIGLAELLRETDPSPRQQEYISLIDSAGRTLTALINDVLDFAKIEAGKLQLVEEAFDLPLLMAECAQMFNLPASDNGTLVLLDMDSNTPSRLVGDPTRLRQVLINLLGNAVKFTRNGRVVLSLSYRQVSNELPLFSFAVTDTGIGLSQEEQARLFQHFAQASADTAKRFGGTGLGLSISRELVALMGGDIHVESAPGKGARFSFSIQMSADSEEVPTVEQEAPPAWLWDVQGNLADWMQADPRFKAVHRVSNSSQLASLGSLEGASVLLINGMPDRELLEETVQLVRISQVPLQILLLTGMRSEVPDWLPQQVQLLRRSVLTVNELKQLLGRQAPSSIPIISQVEGEEAVAALRVLVVEDNPVNQMVTKGYLERLGISRIDIAEDGARALEMFREAAGGYDLVLMDLDMPVMDGFTSAGRMRDSEEREQWPPCQILALSAHAVSELGGRVTRSGMNGQLIKPLSLTAMRDAISQYLKIRA
ncbi:ATP-binding protein [Alcanivorax sp.]|jgi:signal transduction histidine kinase/CheY-like chemotaxis protein|uniref:hybrid sensor histidine kinase/response regulator n=1 Tax=Alcanivorax sp. TaxID=1872427 RepID=UPI0019979533|nr:ATP-binding protein [Alcanivorax sp.]MBD3642709.1 response regulator [Alcanivorax sp.]